MESLPDGEPKEQAPAVLVGRVLDAAGIPVPRGVVQVYEEGPRIFTEPRFLECAGVDGDGRFRVSISPGPCLLVACGPIDNDLRGPGEEAGDPGVRIAPGPGEILEGLEVRLPYALADLGRVRGTVRDPEGRPVPGLTVTLDGSSLAENSCRLEVTDAAGAFAFRETLPGNRRLSVLATRGFLALREEVVLPAGSELVRDLRVPPRSRPGSLSLVLRCDDDRGEGVPGVEISLQDFEDFHEDFWTGADGEVEVEGLPDELAERSLFANAFHQGRWAQGGTWSALDRSWPERIVLRLRSPEDDPDEAEPPGPRPRSFGSEPRLSDAPLRGRVVDAAGVPVPGAGVHWIPGETLPDRPGMSLEVREIGKSDREGRFAVRGLPPGPGFLFADHLGSTWGSPGGRDPGVLRVDLVEGRENAGFEVRLPFALADLATLECRVVDAGGKPRRGVAVRPERWLLRATEGPLLETDADGRISFLVLPGRNEVSAGATATHREALVVVDVLPGGTHEVELRTPAWNPEETRSLRVRVEDASGSPVPGAEVHLSTGEGGLGRGRTGEDGACLFPSLPAEAVDREVHVRAFAEGFAIGSPGAVVTAWPEGGPAEAVVVLLPSREIGIRVVDDATGRFVPGCRVSVRDRTCCSYDEYTAWHHETGGMHRVIPGEVVVRAVAPGYEDLVERVEVPASGDRPVFELRLKRRD